MLALMGATNTASYPSLRVTINAICQVLDQGDRQIQVRPLEGKGFTNWIEKPLKISLLVEADLQVG
jgi:hypothetical protein